MAATKTLSALVGGISPTTAVAKDTSASVKDDVTIVAAERRTTASSSPTRMQCEVEAVIVLSRGRQGSGDSPNLVKVPGAKLKQDTAGGSPGRRSDYGVGERDMGGEVRGNSEPRVFKQAGQPELQTGGSGGQRPHPVPRGQGPCRGRGTPGPGQSREQQGGGRVRSLRRGKRCRGFSRSMRRRRSRRTTRCVST